MLLFVGFLLCLLPQIAWATAMAGRRPTNFATWLLVMGLIFSYPVSWTNFASDYSRYLPSATSWRRIAVAAGGGQFVALVFCEAIGVFFAMAIGGDLSDPVADLPEILPHWYLAPFLLTVIVGSIATNVPNGYTAGLGLLALHLPIRRVSAMLVIACGHLAFRVYTMLAGHALDLYQQWLGYILIWNWRWGGDRCGRFLFAGWTLCRDDLIGWAAEPIGTAGACTGRGWPPFCLGLSPAWCFPTAIFIPAR